MKLIGDAAMLASNEPEPLLELPLGRAYTHAAPTGWKFTLAVNAIR